MNMQQDEEKINLYLSLLDKHQQLLRMYIHDQNLKAARRQFEIIKPIFHFLNEVGITSKYYTAKDFEINSKLFD